MYNNSYYDPYQRQSNPVWNAAAGAGIGSLIGAASGNPGAGALYGAAGGLLLGPSLRNTGVFTGGAKKRRKSPARKVKGGSCWNGKGRMYGGAPSPTRLKSPKKSPMRKAKSPSRR